MRAEILSVGTELLLGHTVNSDAAFVARELSALGIDLLFSCTVGDNPDRLRKTLEEAIKRSELIITTGGLGPTDDDLTKETIAQVAGTPLVRHEASMRRLEKFFQGQVVSLNQSKQAMLPEGADVFPNEMGTAPGCVIKTKTGAHILMLPGPPIELTHMLTTFAVPWLKAQIGSSIFSQKIRLFGIGEGQAAEMLGELTDCLNPTVATYDSFNEVYIRVTAKAKSDREAMEISQPVVKKIFTLFGDLIYGIDVENLESLVIPELIKRNIPIATAESCTGGLLAKRITDVPGASAIFRGSVVAYTAETKRKLLNVPKEMIEKYGVVSAEVAQAMAEGVWRIFHEGFGVGITGIAGPDGGTPEKPVGLIYIALTDGHKTWVHEMRQTHGYTQLHDSRPRLRHMAASQALDMIRRHLFGLPVTLV